MLITVLKLILTEYTLLFMLIYFTQLNLLYLLSHNYFYDKSPLIQWDITWSLFYKICCFIQSSILYKVFQERTKVAMSVRSLISFQCVSLTNQLMECCLSRCWVPASALYSLLGTRHCAVGIGSLQASSVSERGEGRVIG